MLSYEKFNYLRYLLGSYMKSNRNRVFLKTTPPKDEKHLFAITPIIPNIIAIAILATAYWYMNTRYLFLDYQTIAYWVVNVLITYNIIAASAKSFAGPILALLTAFSSMFITMQLNLNIFTPAEFWQLIIVSIIGFIVTIILKL
jgi:hypothetical protein